MFLTRGQHKQRYVLKHVDKAAMAHWRLMDGRVCAMLIISTHKRMLLFPDPAPAGPSRRGQRVKAEPSVCDYITQS